MSGKVMVIGLDAATWDVILPGVAEGRLPNLARLMSQGAHGPLQSVPNMNSLAAWTTFMTGKHPGSTGIYWFYEHAADSYNLRFLNGGDVPAARFWEIAGAAGKKVGIVNVPMTYPAMAVNGFLIAGLDAPGESSPSFTYPTGLYEELQREVGEYLIDTNILGYARSGRWKQALAATEQVIAQRERAATYLLQRYPWDLAVVVYTALDRIQHTFWSDPSAPLPTDVAQLRRASETVFRFYARMDEMVGRMVALAGRDATVLIMSDHGAGFNQRSNMYLLPWLESLGLFHRLQQKESAASAARRALFHRASALADGLISKQWRRRIMQRLPGGRAGIVERLHRVPCDWSRTKAYVDYIQPAIWINLRGREPEGIVAPGAEYEELRTYLINQLTACRDPRTGTPVVKRVCRREEVYHGPYLDEAPDLHIFWNDEALVTGYRYTDAAGHTVTVGTPTDVVERRNVTGDHRPEGIVLLTGPQVQPGQQIIGAHIADIAPTLLYLMDQPVPSDMEGRVLHEALRPEYVAAHPITYTESRAAEGADHVDFTDEEAAQVENRLRGLGYID